MSSNSSTSDIEPLTRLEGQSRRKMSIAIGLVLAFLVVSFYVVTLVRLQGNMSKRAQMQSGTPATAGQSTTTSPINSTQGK